jgi:hypothetical protein
MSAPAPKNLSRHATHRYYTLFLVLGGILTVIGACVLSLLMLAGTVVLSLLLYGAFSFGFGVLLLVRAIYGRRLGAGVQVVNTSFDLIGRGRLGEAEKLLDHVEVRASGKLVRRVAAVQRGLIAMRRADPKGAIAHLDRAIGAPLGVFSRPQQRLQSVNARAIRAFLRASMGDREGARADIEAVRKSPDALAQGLARAALAEAILMERAGDRDALREHLVRERALLIDGTDRRERAIVRAFQRMLETTASSVYRKTARRDESAEEPALADWVAEMVPAAAPFVERRGQKARTGDIAALAPAAPPEEARRAVAEARKAAAKSAPAAKRSRRAALTLWLALCGVIGGVYWALAPSSRRAEWPTDEPPPDPTALPIYLLLGLIVVLVAVLVTAGLSAYRASQELIAALAEVGKGNLARAEPELERLTKTRFALIAAQAHLALAHLAEKKGNLAEALAQCDKGIGRLSQYTLRISASDILLPDLIAERAFVLAATDRQAEAEAELATLPEAYPYQSRARFRVRLASLVRKGDLKAAATLAREAGLDLPLSARDELLADATRAATSPETAGAGEVARIKRELRTDKDVRRWMETVAPAALAALEAASEDGHLSSSAEAERDARAEEEARAEEAARARPDYLASVVTVSK